MKLPDLTLTGPENNPPGNGGVKELFNRFSNLMSLHQFAPPALAVFAGEDVDDVGGGGTTTDHDSFNDGTQNRSGERTGTPTVWNWFWMPTPGGFVIPPNPVP